MEIFEDKDKENMKYKFINNFILFKQSYIIRKSFKLIY